MRMLPNRSSLGQSNDWKAFRSSDSKPIPQIGWYRLSSARILSPLSEHGWRKGVG